MLYGETSSEIVTGIASRYSHYTSGVRPFGSTARRLRNALTMRASSNRPRLWLITRQAGDGVRKARCDSRVWSGGSFCILSLLAQRPTNKYMRALTCLLLTCAILAPSADLKVNKYVYPTAKKVDVVDDYHGTKVADPYRWLEDTNSVETTAWVEAENKVTAAYFAQIPQRAKLHERLTELFNYERYSNAFEVAGKYFLFRNNGLQNQDILYVADKPDGPERVLLDPNTLRADGTAALSGLSVDRSAKLLAYAIAQAGSDWSEWHVRDIATGKDLPDSVQWTKFTSAEWTADGRAFYYQRFPEPNDKAALTASNKNAQLYLHTIGEPQSSDKLIYQRPDHPNWLFGSTVSDDGRYLALDIQTGDASRNMLFYQDLHGTEPKTVELIKPAPGAIPLSRQSRLHIFRVYHRQRAQRPCHRDRCESAGAGATGRRSFRSSRKR